VEEVASKVAGAEVATEDVVEEVAEAAEEEAEVVAVHSIQTIPSRAYQMQNGLHCDLKNRRKLGRLATRKEMAMLWTLMMRKNNNNKMFLGQAIKSHGATRRTRSELKSSWLLGRSRRCKTVLQYTELR